MKIRNHEMIRFLNASENLRKKKLPSKLYFAISCNIKALIGMAEPYNEALEKAQAEGTHAVTELLNQEIDAAIQTVPKTIFEVLDSSDKFDALTGDEIDAIIFMIEK